MQEHLGPIADAVEDALEDLEDGDAVARIWAGDHSLWSPDPAEIENRLGWLESPDEYVGEVSDLRTFARSIVDDGITDVVLCGMGGSSLFPLVMSETFGDGDGGGLRLHVLDSTDPLALRRASTVAPLEDLLVVVASKSGTTIETRSHLEYFWQRLVDSATVTDPGAHVVAITDPDSALVDLAAERGFRRVFENNPDIGGRFSALSYFGLVPAALVGVDLTELLGRAAKVANASNPEVVSPDNPAARLGAVLGGAVRAGRDKLTLLLPEAIASFGAWIEQLVAESTGKDGTGIVPIVGEDVPEDLDVYGDDRLFVSFGRAPGLEELVDAGHPAIELGMEDRLDIGVEVFRWEFATAVVGALLEVNPFDQPDVAAAKEATARVLADGLPDLQPEPLDPLLERVETGDYLAILAFVDPGAAVVAGLERSRTALRDRLGVATTLGIGPRYLHSTGQLHKGGPHTGVFLQVVSDTPDDVAIPGEPHGFSTLKRAQAAGDLTALRARGRRVARVSLDDLLALAP